MNTYITAHAAHPLGRWLATLAVSLVLLALAYAQAPDPAGYLGLRSPSARPLVNSRSAPNQAPSLASAQLGQPTSMAVHAR